MDLNLIIVLKLEIWGKNKEENRCNDKSVGCDFAANI